MELQLADTMVLQMITWCALADPAAVHGRGTGPGSSGCRMRPPCTGMGVPARQTSAFCPPLQTGTGWLRALGRAEHHQISASSSLGKSKSQYFYAYTQQWGDIRGWPLSQACRHLGLACRWECGGSYLPRRDRALSVALGHVHFWDR